MYCSTIYKKSKENYFNMPYNFRIVSAVFFTLVDNFSWRSWIKVKKDYLVNKWIASALKTCVESANTSAKHLYDAKLSDNTWPKSVYREFYLILRFIFCIAPSLLIQFSYRYKLFYHWIYFLKISYVDNYVFLI